MENIISYTGLFIALLFNAGLIINGIYIVTRGETITAPDGTKKDQNNMILYPLLKWITQKKGEYFIQYKGDQLVKLLSEINKRYPHAPISELSVDDSIIFRQTGSTGPGTMFMAWMIWVKEYLDSRDIVIEEQVTSSSEVCVIKLKERYPIYKFSVYMRKPILQCIKCMASVWGTIIYWPSVLLVFEFDLVQVPIWIAFCFALTWVNTYLYNKIS
jgi:hypothetical protein